MHSIAYFIFCVVYFYTGIVRIAYQMEKGSALPKSRARESVAPDFYDHIDRCGIPVLYVGSYST